MRTSHSRQWLAGLMPLASALLTACAPATRQAPANGIIAADPATAMTLGAPRVSISTEYEYGTFREVRTRLRVTDDAYVLVVNVSPDGATRILFPETPKDNGLLRGDNSYQLPRFFGGYPSMALEMTTSTTQFVRVGRSVLASPQVHGPGYTFVLASRTPFDLERLEDEGLFDWAELGRTLHDLEPDAVIPIVAGLAMGSQGHFVVSSDIARYAGYDPLVGTRVSYAYASAGAPRFCSAQLVREWPYLSTRPLPEACYQTLPRVRRAYRPVPPPADSTPRTPGTPSDTAETPGDSGSKSDSGSTSPEAPRRPRPRPVDGGVTSHRDLAIDSPRSAVIELDRHTRAEMLQRERLEARRSQLEGQLGAAGDRRRPRANRDDDSDRRRSAPRSADASPRPSTSGAERAAAGSSSTTTSSSASSSGGSSGSGEARSRPQSQLPDRGP